MRAPDKRVSNFTARPCIWTYGLNHSPFHRSRNQATRPQNDCVGNISSVDIESNDQQVANTSVWLSGVLIPRLLLRKRAACCTFSNRCAKRLVRVLLNSSIDRRVLDEEHPDSTQSARDRQSINRSGGILFTPLPEPRPVVSIESINSATRSRLAFRPSAHPLFCSKRAQAYSEIFSNVSTYEDPFLMHPCRLGQPVEHGLTVLTFVADVQGASN